MNSAEQTIKQFVPAGSALYYSLRYLPKNLRPLISLLFTLSRVLQQIPRTCSDSQIARQKLQWWRIEYERCFSRNPTHPLTQALQPFLSIPSRNSAPYYAITAQPFNQCVDALELQFEQQVYETQKDLEEHYIGVSAIEILALQITASSEQLPELPEAYTSNFCCSWQVSQQLQQLNLLLLHHQAKFTDAQLQEVTLAELNACLNRNKQKKNTSPAVEALLKNLHQQAQSYYQQALMNLDDWQQNQQGQRLNQLPFLIYTELQLELLNEIAAENYPVFTHAIDITPLRKLWLARCIKKREFKKQAKDH